MTTVEPIPTTKIAWDSTTYVKQTLRQIWEDMPLFLFASLLVSLAALPQLLMILLTGRAAWIGTGAFTVVPVWAAFGYMVGKSSIQEKPRLRHLKNAFTTYYRRSVLTGLPLAGILALVLISWNPDILDAPTPVHIGLALQIFMFLLISLLSLFAIVMVALFDLSVTQAWLYSFVLTVRSPIVALGLASMLVLLIFAAITIGPGIWLIIPMIFVPFEVNATLMLTKQRLAEENTR